MWCHIHFPGSHLTSINKVRVSLDHKVHYGNVADGFIKCPDQDGSGKPFSHYVALQRCGRKGVGRLGRKD